VDSTGATDQSNRHIAAEIRQPAEVSMASVGVSGDTSTQMPGLGTVDRRLEVS
jgi:hypothetical protein